MKGWARGKATENQAPDQSLRTVRVANKADSRTQPDWRGANNDHEPPNRPFVSRFFSSLLGVFSHQVIQ